MKYTFFLFGLLVLLVAFLLRARTLPPTENTQSFYSPTPLSTISLAPSSLPSELPAPLASAVTPSPVSSYYYPMTRYNDRTIVRWYGKRVTAEDRKPLPCGDVFLGYHTGDDLEAFPGELTQEVPVYAIALGTVRFVGEANGYGGLIVIEHTINNKPVTSYYGHVDNKQVALQVGSTVKAGERIAYLGDHCTGEASNERKHLHFSMRYGMGVDIRGYADTQNEVENWANPKELLSELGAASPPSS